MYYIIPFYIILYSIKRNDNKCSLSQFLKYSLYILFSNVLYDFFKGNEIFSLNLIFNIEFLMEFVSLISIIFTSILNAYSSIQSIFNYIIHPYFLNVNSVEALRDFLSIKTNKLIITYLPHDNNLKNLNFENNLQETNRFRSKSDIDLIQLKSKINDEYNDEINLSVDINHSKTHLKKKSSKMFKYENICENINLNFNKTEYLETTENENSNHINYSNPDSFCSIKKTKSQNSCNFYNNNFSTFNSKFYSNDKKRKFKAEDCNIKEKDEINENIENIEKNEKVSSNVVENKTKLDFNKVKFSKISFSNKHLSKNNIDIEFNNHNNLEKSLNNNNETKDKTYLLKNDVSDNLLSDVFRNEYIEKSSVNNKFKTISNNLGIKRTLDFNSIDNENEVSTKKGNANFSNESDYSMNFKVFKIDKISANENFIKNEKVENIEYINQMYDNKNSIFKLIYNYALYKHKDIEIEEIITNIPIYISSLKNYITGVIFRYIEYIKIHFFNSLNWLTYYFFGKILGYYSIYKVLITLKNYFLSDYSDINLMLKDELVNIIDKILHICFFILKFEYSFLYTVIEQYFSLFVVGIMAVVNMRSFLNTIHFLYVRAIKHIDSNVMFETLIMCYLVGMLYLTSSILMIFSLPKTYRTNILNTFEKMDYSLLRYYCDLIFLLSCIVFFVIEIIFLFYSLIDRRNKDKSL